MEGETLRRLAAIRSAIVGEVNDAAGTDAVRAALSRLFDGFIAHRGTPDRAHVELIGKVWIEPLVREEAIEENGDTIMPRLRPGNTSIGLLDPFGFPAWARPAGAREGQIQGRRGWDCVQEESFSLAYRFSFKERRLKGATAEQPLSAPIPASANVALATQADKVCILCIPWGTGGSQMRSIRIWGPVSAASAKGASFTGFAGRRSPARQPSGRSRVGALAATLALAAALLGIVLPGAALGAGSDVVKPAGTLEALPADQASRAKGPESPGRQAIPLRVPDRDKLERAKARAALQGRGASGALAPEPRATVFGGLNQPGLVADGTGTPPDTTGAIGPNFYLEMVNREVAVYDRTNLNQLSSTGLDDFVGFPGFNVFDPQIQWDQQGNRWLYVADDTTGGNFLDFGWSKTADPSDLVNGWCQFSVNTDPLFDDYPKLGHDDNHIIFGTNAFNGGFQTSRIIVFPKPAAGDASCPTDLSGTAFGSPGSPLTSADGNPVFTPVPANTANGSSAGYVVAADSPFFAGSPQQIMGWHVGGSAGAPTLIQDGNMNVTPYDVPANVPQPGSANVLDSSDARLTQAVSHPDPGASGQDAVWTQHTIGGPGGRSVMRWYELLPGSLTVRQQGTISDPSHFVFNGAISPTSGGDVAAVNYNLGSASLLPEIRARSRGASSPLGQMAGEVTLGTSAAAAQDFSCSPSPCRWGDYAGASPDPANPNLVWGSNQGLGPAAGATPAWTTRNFALEAAPPAPTVSSTNPASPANDNNPKVIGSAAASSTVKLYANSTCTGAMLGSGSSASFASPGITAAVADNSTTTIYATATDAASNVSACSSSSVTYTEDSIPPETSITSGPAAGATINTDSASFGFSSNQPGSTFQCSLDSAAYASCSSPKSYSSLPDGAHSFAVRATDPAGNTDPTPASRSFVVDTTPPDTSVDGKATAKKKQKQKGKKIVVKVKVKAKEDLTAKANGKVKVKKKTYKLKPQSNSVSEGDKKTLKLKPKKRKYAKKIVKALKKGKKAKAKLTVKLTDEAGNTKTKKLKVQLKR